MHPHIVLAPLLVKQLQTSPSTTQRNSVQNQKFLPNGVSTRKYGTNKSDKYSQNTYSFFILEHFLYMNIGPYFTKMLPESTQPESTLIAPSPAPVCSTTLSPAAALPPTPSSSTAPPQASDTSPPSPTGPRFWICPTTI